MGTTRTILVSLSLVGMAAHAQDEGLPSGPMTDCAIIEEHGQMLEIFQLTPNCVINWERFTIDFEHIVHFVRQQGSWRVLNRVTGDTFTQIAGTMSADGHVFIVNPAGVYFDGTAVVNVGGLYAAAGDISDVDFMGGVDHFTNLSGEVINQGTLSASAIHLVGERVANHGTINAPGGVVTMVAGNDDVLLAEAGGRIMVRIDGEDLQVGTTGAGGPVAGGTPAVENTGTINATGGRVVLGAGDLFSLALSNRGQINASGGTVTLAANGGTVRSSGEVEADRVELSGDVLALSGSLRGRDVLVDDAAVIEGDLTVGGDGGGVAELVTFRNSVDGSVVDPGRLMIDATSAQFEGAVGAAVPLDTLQTTGGVTALAGIRTSEVLDLGGPAHITGNVLAGGTATFGGDTTIVGSLTADDNVHFLAGANIAGSITADDDVTIDGDVQIGVGVTVAEDFEVGGNIVVNGNVLVNEDLEIGGTSVIGGSVLVGEDADFGGSAQISGSVTAGEDVEFFADGTVGGNVIAILDDVIFGGNAQVNGSITSGDDVRIFGDAQIFGNVVAGGDDAVFFGDAFVGGTVQAFEDARFFGNTVVGGSVNAGDDIDFTGTATVIGNVAAGDDVRFGGVTTIGGAINALDDVEFMAHADVNGTITAGDDIEFQSTANLGGSLLATGRVEFGGDAIFDGIGDQRIVAPDRLDADGVVIKTTNGALEIVSERMRFDGGLVESMGDLRLNPDGRNILAELATIGSSGDLVMRSQLGEVFIGANEKVTAVGDLTIEGATRVTVGDLNALGDMTVTAPEIFIHTRAPGVFRDFRGVLVMDGGVDFVAGGRFLFSVVPTLLGNGAAPRLASTLLGADVLGTLPFEQRILSFFNQGIFALGRNLVDVSAEGPTASQLGEALDGDLPVALASLVARGDEPLSVADLDTLEDLGVALRATDANPRTPAEAVVIEDAAFGQAPLATTQGRMRPDAVRVVLDAYRGLRANRDRHVTLLDAAWRAHRVTTNRPTGETLGAYLVANPGFSDLRTVLDQLEALLDQAEMIGLGPAETMVMQRRMIEVVVPSTLVPADELLAALTVVRASSN